MIIQGTRPVLTDQQIIAEVLSGKVRDFRLLITRYERRVYTLCARVLENREDAQDSTQDAFIRAYSSLAGFDTGLPLWPWLRKIALNCCFRRAKARASRCETELFDTWPSEAGFMDDLICKEESQRILQAVSGLPDAYRTVVVLRYQEELSSSEIADALGETPGAVRVRLHRALKMLANRLAVTVDDM